MCVPDIPEIKELILKEAHETPYSIHPGSTKMYMDLKELFWWNNMKREIAKFVSECHTYQRVKAEHQSPAGLMQPLNIPVEMGRDWNGLYHRVTIDTEEKGHDLGNCGQAD
jgi:hypothetical protein